MKNSLTKYWYFAVVFAVTAIASTMIIGQQPVKPLTTAEIDDIREAVFLYQFLHNASGQQSKANAYFLSIEDDKDPEDAFMERFKDHKPPVKKASQATGKFTEIRDKETGLSGLQFRVDSIKQIGPNKVEVSGGYNEAGLSASGNTYTVERVKDKWVVTHDEMKWIA